MVLQTRNRTRDLANFWEHERKRSRVRNVLGPSVVLLRDGADKNDRNFDKEQRARRVPRRVPATHLDTCRRVVGEPTSAVLFNILSTEWSPPDLWPCKSVASSLYDFQNSPFCKTFCFFSFRQKFASSENRTHDPQFTRLVLCPWAMKAHLKLFFRERRSKASKSSGQVSPEALHKSPINQLGRASLSQD